ncbi:MAG: DUF3160 domain-containing protein [Candidatus Heimdallarchaeota archaeon]
MKKRTIILVSIVSSLILGSVLVGVLVPTFNRNYGDFSGGELLPGTAATFSIKNDVTTAFGTYSPNDPTYSPRIPYKEILSNLGNVDTLEMSFTNKEKELLATNGFFLKPRIDGDLLDIYSFDTGSYFVSTDVCLHLFHLMFDYSLKLLELSNFYNNFYDLLTILRDDQLVLYDDIPDPDIQEALVNNIGYLSVMAYFFDENVSAIPDICRDNALQEIYNIGNLTAAFSSIFGYLELFELYLVRGHYNDHVLLPNYFKAMMYAGRMGFLLNSLPHSRMTMLLVNSLNSTSIGLTETLLDLWSCLYNPIVFYVGESDDLTARECLTILETIGSPEPADFDDAKVQEFMDEASNYRLPKVNSMFLSNMDDYQNKTHSFRLFGQRFVPDSYIFQQVMHPHVFARGPPKALDVFSVFGSPRADLHLSDENQTYPGYDLQIDNLRDEFGGLNETYWTQNLYWMWLYTLFPLLEPAQEGYPGFMQNDAWSDKALMTVLASYTELKHDTILYAKQPYATLGWFPDFHGYVEPYPDVYARLSSLTQYMIDGLQNRSSQMDDFLGQLQLMKSLFERLTTISIAELNNEKMSDEDNSYLITIGHTLYEIYHYDKWYGLEVTKERSALVADIAGYFDDFGGVVLEVAVGNPCDIYVVVQDHKGNLLVTHGAAYSYYEFNQPIGDILNDETWQEMLDTNPPPMPEWIVSSVPILQTTVASTLICMDSKRRLVTIVL